MKEKKFNMAEGDYRNAEAVFDCQVRAHKTFFEKQLPLQKTHWPSFMESWTGIVYDITGFNGQEVVALLTIIVNSRDKFNSDNFFYFMIRNSSGVKLLYRILPKPHPDQPGNGFVEIHIGPPNNQHQNFRGKPYDKLTKALKEKYVADTKSFAQDIKKLLKDNTQNEAIPEATMEAYMLLLFEIARRLVKLENPTPRKEEFDNLPIGSAIARLINLLELGKSTFDDVFLKEEKFHCFTGEPDKRRKVIEEINMTPMEMAPDPEEELREMFCPEKQPAEILAEELTNLKVSE